MKTVAFTLTVAAIARISARNGTVDTKEANVEFSTIIYIRLKKVIIFHVKR